MTTTEQTALDALDSTPGVPRLGGWAGRVMRVLDGLFAWLATLALLGIVVVVVLQVVSRLLLPITLAWTEELSRYLFIYMVALASGLILRRRHNVSLELFQHRLGLRGQALYQAGVCIALGGFSLVALGPAWRFAGIGAFQTSPTLGVPMIWVFMSMVVLLGLVLFYSVIGLVEAALALRKSSHPAGEA